jgi:pimeloyl-ACP methyl ester carboxylesterase
MTDVVVPSLWRELRAALELPELLCSRIYRRPPRAENPGLPVMLIPGVYAADAFMAPMASWLKRMGYAPKRAGIRFNADCSEAEMARLEVRLERAAKLGQRVAIVGWSRGGLFARALAVRHPDLTAGVVTLGSPLLGPLRYSHPALHLAIELTTSLGDRGVPRLFTHGCADEWTLEGAADQSRLSRALVAHARRRLGSGESCCAQFWHDVRAQFPSGIEFTSFYSRTDGIVNWRGCLAPDARHVQVDSSHCGMVFSKRVYPALAVELARICQAERIGGGEPALAA